MATISVKEAKIWRESHRLKQSVAIRRNFAIIQCLFFRRAEMVRLLCEKSEESLQRTFACLWTEMSPLLGSNDRNAASPIARLDIAPYPILLMFWFAIQEQYLRIR
jgi:hypothetical protein